MAKKLLTNGLILGLFTIFMIFCFAALGIGSYLPRPEVTDGLRGVFNTFLAGANTITLTTTGGVLLIITGGVAVALWFGLATSVALWFKVSKVRSGALEARNLALQAGVVTDQAPLGVQVYKTYLDPDLAKRAVTDALHLQVSRRANGIQVEPSPQDVQLWQFNQLASGPTRGPGGDIPTHPLQHHSYLPAPATLPDEVRWFDVVPGHRGNLHNLVMGVRVVETGQLAPVTISLYDLFHTLAAASTGWGKSGFLCSILAQLATCPDPVDFVLIDQQLHGLAGFKTCDRLRYPILRDRGEILDALAEIYAEAVEQRSALLARYDADDLQEYNRIAGEYLPPIIVAVDEASALLADKALGRELKRHTWELRKFGVYQMLAMTTAKGTVIDTDHRQQFSSKVQLHANDRGQARLLLDAPEALTFPPGRAVIDVAGKTPAIIQTPWISKREVRALLRSTNDPPAAPPPRPAEEPSRTAADAEFVRLVREEGLSRRQASLQAYSRSYAGDLVDRAAKLLNETQEEVN